MNSELFKYYTSIDVNKKKLADNIQIDYTNIIALINNLYDDTNWYWEIVDERTYCNKYLCTTVNVYIPGCVLSGRATCLLANLNDVNNNHAQAIFNAVNGRLMFVKPNVNISTTSNNQASRYNNHTDLYNQITNTNSYNSKVSQPSNVTSSPIEINITADEDKQEPIIDLDDDEHCPERLKNIPKEKRAKYRENPLMLTTDEIIARINDPNQVRDLDTYEEGDEDLIPGTPEWNWRYTHQGPDPNDPMKSPEEVKRDKLKEEQRKVIEEWKSQQHNKQQEQSQDITKQEQGMQQPNINNSNRQDNTSEVPNVATSLGVPQEYNQIATALVDSGYMGEATLIKTIPRERYPIITKVNITQEVVKNRIDEFTHVYDTNKVDANGNKVLRWTQEQINLVNRFKKQAGILNDKMFDKWVTTWRSDLKGKHDLTPENVNDFLAWFESLKK